MAVSQQVSLGSLTWRHFVKVVPAERRSVENCVLAVAAVVVHDCILSASRMNSTIVMFLNNVDKANEAVETVVNDSLTLVE